MSKVYLSAAELSVIMSALRYAAEQTEASEGAVDIFLSDATFNSEAEHRSEVLAMAEVCRDIINTLSQDDICGTDCMLESIE